MPLQNTQEPLNNRVRASSNRANVQRRNALVTFFLIPGIAMASWVTRTPAIRDAIDASLAEMGLVLLGLSLGSLIGVLGSGRVVARVGTKATSLTGLWLTVASLICIATGVLLRSAPIVTLGLALFGLGMGMCEIAVNIDGAEVERRMQRSVMHVLHGSYSLGTLLGALIGLALNTLDVPVALHLLAVAALVAPGIVCFARYVPTGFGKRETPAAQHSETQHPTNEQQHAASEAESQHMTIQVARSARTAPATELPLWRDPRLLLIGFIAFGMALAEGTANDWLPIFMVDEHGTTESFGALTFALFAACMTLGRLGGGAFVDHLGRATSLRLSALLAAVGVGLAAFGSGQILAAIAVVCWGIGTSLAFPLAISAAGQSGSHPATRVQIVAVLGYIALLVGPPALGFVGEHTSLRIAFMIVLGIITAVLLAAPAVGGKDAAVSTGKASSTQ